MQTVILGAGGMLGRALGREFPDAERFTRAALDITDGAALRAALGTDTRLVLNAAADTRVDAAESDAHHVLVNDVAPGFVRTRMSVVNGVNELDSQWFADVYQTYGKLPLRRAAAPAEIAATIAYLLSPDNTYVTGTSVLVDGGLTATF